MNTNINNQLSDLDLKIYQSIENKKQILLSKK